MSLSAHPHMLPSTQPNSRPSSPPTDAASAPRLVLDEITEVSLPSGEYTGQVKWFNDRLGYGFCTVISDGRYKGRDIFAHHSGIRPMSSNYKTLRKGEYINFNVMNGHNGLQAIDVTGINGGPLMCDVAPMRNRLLQLAET
jgi:CspA family cold shock protein